jgi:hypothetical protein
MGEQQDGSRAALERDYERAQAVHDRLWARITWWERWRGWMTVPMIAVGLGIGLLLGKGLLKLIPLPWQTEWIVGVLMIVVVGRVVTSVFDVRQLDAARRRVDSLAQRLGKLPRTPRPRA